MLARVDRAQLIRTLIEGNLSSCRVRRPCCAFGHIVGRKREVLDPREGKERRTPALWFGGARRPVPIGVSRLRPTGATPVRGVLPAGSGALGGAIAGRPRRLVCSVRLRGCRTRARRAPEV